MLIATGTDLIAAKLNELNRTHLAAGGRAALQLEDMTWQARSFEIVAQAQYLLVTERPSMDLLATVGAKVLAAMLAVDAAEVVRIETGDAA